MKKIENEIEWIDIHDESLMIELGIHYPDYIEPDFCKTPKEKKMLAKMKRSASNCTNNSPVPPPPSFPLYDKIIISLKKNDNYPYTTYSRKIWQSQIPCIVNSFVTKKGKSVVDHYMWNGKRYSANEIPVNPYKCVKIYR